jgi:hypothetical protein
MTHTYTHKATLQEIDQWNPTEIVIIYDNFCPSVHNRLPCINQEKIKTLNTKIDILHQLKGFVGFI